jgi:sigma-54 dependent transcriptional regulator, acetoin dehydrogenase operon transcriptional activator AcoR
MNFVVELPNEIKLRAPDRRESDAGLFGVDRPGVAWDWMVQTGQPPEGADWVRPQVAEAWFRCIEDYGLAPGVGHLWPHNAGDIGITGRSNRVADIDLRTTLATLAFNLQPVLRDTSVSLLLSDGSGTLIHAMEAGSNLGSIGRKLLRLGESWNERTIGNNGMGTAVVLGETVAFDGKEHFSSVLHPFATVGHPLFAYDGALVAVLGLITDKRASAQTLLGFGRIAGHLIETNLFECQAPGPYMLRLRTSKISVGSIENNVLLEGLIALDGNGKIVGATRAGLHLLGYERHSDVLFLPVKTILGLSVAELRSYLARGELIEVDLANGWRLRVEFMTRNIAPSGDVSMSAGVADDKSVRGRRIMRRSVPAADYIKQDPWRDAVLESALQKAIQLQKQKIPILITGESGVGKDHLVRLFHANGARKGRPLVLVNCAAIPHELISSELFGYTPGSFTGARNSGKQGKFVEAHTGVLFLDEIGDMALDLQTALLCALDSSEIVPVGGSKPIVVDVQVIAATNCDLSGCVKNGTFRRDLYYRLNGAQFWLPPLRERPDKLGLIQNLWAEEMKAQNVAQNKTLSAEVWDIFERHPWPGNIRELRNVLRSCLAMTLGSETRVSDLPDDFMRELDSVAQNEVRNKAAESRWPKPELNQETKALSDWEAEAIRAALEKTSGNISQSARALGITRATLYHKIARFGLRR